MKDLYEFDTDTNVRRTRHKPFEGRVKVFVVAEDDMDRTRVIHFETEDFYIESRTHEEVINTYTGHNQKLFMPTTYSVDIGALEVMDDRGTVFRYENFLNEEVVDEPTFNEEDYE